MSRVNIGINPLYLADQHLIAESVEITMITGQLKKNNFQIKSEIPDSFKLGTGHINFFKNKVLYLHKRLNEVNKEMKRRGFNPGTHLNLDEFPKELVNDYNPSQIDSDIIRDRVSSRLKNRSDGRPGNGFYRYGKKLIENISPFAENVKKSKLFYV